MKFFSPLILIFIFFISQGCNPKKDQQKLDLNLNHSEQTEVVENKLPNNYYKRLIGDINGDEVVMHIQSNASVFNGVYFSKDLPYAFFSDSLINANQIQFYQYSLGLDGSNADDQFFSLEWKEDGFLVRDNSYNDGLEKGIFLKEEYPEGSFLFDVFYYADSLKIKIDDLNNSSALIDFYYLKAQGKNKSATFINNEIAKLLNINSKQNNWVTELKKQACTYIIERKTELEANEFSTHYTNSSQLNIYLNQNHFVIINNLNNDYSGGAHGNYGSNMICLDVKNKKKLKLSDIIKIDPNELQILVESNFRKQFKLKPSESLNNILFDDFLIPNDNFFFNTKGLMFLYNPYEIASYAQGQIVVFIPFSEIKSNLNTEFKKRLNL